MSVLSYGWDRRNQMFVTSMEEMVASDSCLSRLSVTMREARIVDLFGNARFPRSRGMEVWGTSKQVNHDSGRARMPLEDFGFKNMELNREDSQTIPKDEGPVDLRVREPRQRMGPIIPVIYLSWYSMDIENVFGRV